jgi:MerR family copper efflux transcriptional regulator
MRISELARRAGVTQHALRHYECLGLLHPGRTAGGYRDYPESARREVVFIAMSREIGFSLKEIAQQLPLYRAGRLGYDDVAEAMRQRIAAIDAQIGQLKAQRQRAADHITWLAQQKKQWQARQRTQPRRKPWPGTQPKENTHA